MSVTWIYCAKHQYKGVHKCWGCSIEELEKDNERLRIELGEAQQWIDSEPDWKNKYMENYSKLLKQLESQQLEIDSLKINLKSYADLMNEKDVQIQEFKKRSGFTYCAYCGQEFMVDAPYSAIAVSEHVQTCPKHPLKWRIDQLKVACDIFELQAQQATEKVSQLESELTKMKESAVVLKKVIGKLTEDNHGMVPNWLLDLV